MTQDQFSPECSTESFDLPPSCEQALLERFLKAEAMALWTVRSSQLQDVPPNVLVFLRTHEADEREHLAQFEFPAVIRTAQDARAHRLRVF